MTSPTKEQWAEIERNLEYPWGCVALLCDGYKVQAVVKQKSPLKFVVEVYVDGFIKGEWYKGESEEPKKFHRAVKHYVYKPTARAKAKSELAKKRLHPTLKDLYKSTAESHFIMWHPHWPSPKAFCKHIQKTCKSIEYVGDKHAA